MYKTLPIRYYNGDEKVDKKDIVLTGFYNARLNSQQEAQLIYNLPSEQTIKMSSEGNDYTEGEPAWYIYNRCTQLDKIIGSHWGTASEWTEKAQQEGYSLGNAAKVGAVACFLTDDADGNKKDHLAFVEYLNSDGSFIVSEMPSPKILNWRYINPQAQAVFIYL
ncbi:CHAP domain-containing protein [Streptococcus devriesei]|uniref:CHAP domain-containing protein n=1 Tax=Streptococcus devriesei TaxID=231233 RepID=UPI0004237149|nr:CHAP domain-containing protein [Streptococcus devriesei]